MNLALWEKSLRDAFWLLLACATIMFAFLWLFVYTTSFVTASAFFEFMAELPDETQNLFGISLKEAASWRGRLALGFVDPTVVVISAIWAIARGSNSVSGPLDRGTMEMLLAQPISRISILTAHSVVTILGAAVLAVAAWCGLRAGIATVSVEESRWMGLYTFGFYTEEVPLADLIDARPYWFGAFNLFSLTVLAAAIATLVSACGRYRWRTIGIMGGFYFIQIIMKVAALAAEHLDWLFYGTFMGAYWPQILAVEAAKEMPNAAWSLTLQYNGILLGIAAICLVAAGLIFQRRDLPAPL